MVCALIRNLYTLFIDFTSVHGACFVVLIIYEECFSVIYISCVANIILLCLDTTIPHSRRVGTEGGNQYIQAK